MCARLSVSDLIGAPAQADKQNQTFNSFWETAIRNGGGGKGGASRQIYKIQDFVGNIEGGYQKKYSNREIIFLAHERSKECHIATMVCLSGRS